MERFFQASKRQVPPFSVNSHPSVQNRSTLQLIYQQGPLSPQCLATNSSKLSREQLETLFNQMVECVVGWGLLDGERISALDGSKLPTPPTYQGCRKLKQTRSVKIKGQKERMTEEYYVYGWKVLVLIDVHTR